MTDTEQKAAAKPVRKPQAPKWRVRAHNPDDYSGQSNKTVATFEGDTGEAQARTYIKQHHPRGREVFLHAPDGGMEHYSADLDAQGSDPWTEYSEDEDA
jgi:hypothetical protein